MKSPIKNAILNGDRIFFSFRLRQSEERQLMSVINTIPGRQYHGKTGKWSIPLNRYGIEKAKELDFSLNADLLKFDKEGTSKKHTTNIPEGLALYNFQKEDVERLEELDGRALLSLQQRCGKTIIAICYMINHPEFRPTIIIPPASVKINWSRELTKWMPGEKHVIVQGHSQALSDKDNIIIINYDILSTYLDLLVDMNPKLLIIDESQAIRNVSALRSRAVKYLGKNIPHILCLSGTPIVNRPKEFFMTLNLLDSSMFPSREKFLIEYCNYSNDRTGKGHSNMERLHTVLIQSFMIRHLRKDVVKDLPEKATSIVPMEITNRREYEEAKADIIQYIQEHDGDAAARRAAWAETLVRFEKLKQLSVKGKFDQVIEWIENFIESEKLVVFCIHRNVVKQLAEKFEGRCVTLSGGCSPNQKQKAIDSFQDDPGVTLFIGNIIAAGQGIKLSAADNVAFIELDWVPGNMDQASDRVIDMEKKVPTMAYYLVGMDTVELEIAEMIDKKRKVLDAIMDGKVTEDESLLTVLIEKYKKEGIKK